MIKENVFQKRVDGVNLPAKGFHGTCTWSIDDNGTMRIYPTNGFSGKLQTLGAYADVKSPWCKSAALIKKIVVEPGVRVHPESAFLFAELPYCEEMDLKHLNTEGLRNASNMFYGNSALRKLNVSHFDTRRLDDVSLMFSDCPALTELKLFEIPSYAVQAGMIYGCHKLKVYETPKGKKRVGWF